MQPCVNIVDLVKNFQTNYSNEYLLAKFGVDTAENGPLKVCQQFAKSLKLVKKVGKNIGAGRVRRLARAAPRPVPAEGAEDPRGVGDGAPVAAAPERHLQGVRVRGQILMKRFRNFTKFHIN